MSATLTAVIDGNNFSTVEEFYDEVETTLTKSLDWRIGHNLNAFNDILYGGFGVHNYDESLQLYWKHFEKSKADLSNNEAGTNGQTFFETVLDIIKSHNTHIKLVTDEDSEF